MDCKMEKAFLYLIWNLVVEISTSYYWFLCLNYNIFFISFFRMKYPYIGKNKQVYDEHLNSLCKLEMKYFYTFFHFYTSIQNEKKKLI